MTSLVFDTNLIDSVDLERFLSESNTHKVVLIDFLAIESFKSKRTDAFKRRMKVTANYPNQVVVLKDTAQIMSLCGTQSVLVESMIDRDQTENFSIVSDYVNSPNNGHHDYMSEILQRQIQAQKHLNGLLAMADSMLASYLALQSQFLDRE